MAARSKGGNVFYRSNTGIVGSNPTRGIDVYLHLFCVFIVLYGQRPCDRVDHLSRESYRLAIRSTIPHSDGNRPEGVIEKEEEK
jgi:hypothetical protein